MWVQQEQTSPCLMVQETPMYGDFGDDLLLLYQYYIYIYKSLLEIHLDLFLICDLQLAEERCPKLDQHWMLFVSGIPPALGVSSYPKLYQR